MNNLIPIIDISELVKNGLNSNKSSNTVEQINKACLKSGFFQIEGHGISSQIISSTLLSCKKFFNYLL